MLFRGASISAQTASLFVLQISSLKMNLLNSICLMLKHKKAKHTSGAAGLQML